MTDRIKEILAVTARDWSLHERNRHHSERSRQTAGAGLPNGFSAASGNRLSTAGMPQMAGLAFPT